ncbi:MAG: putative quinol monooxygenase [Deinococcales bacterium]
MLIVAGSFFVKEGMRDDFLDLAERYSQAVRLKKGCLHYQLYPDLNEADQVFIFERWESAEDLRAHLKNPVAPEVQALRDQYPQYLAKSAELYKYEIAAAQPL